MSVEDLEKTYSDISKKAREMADDVSSALAKGIDVADGGAYISDTMCEMLLRMEGAYSTEIQEAFKILRGETKADYLGQIDAYQKVLTSVIGNQKYTAFGRRLQNGTSVPYYHRWLCSQSLIALLLVRCVTSMTRCKNKVSTCCLLSLLLK